ncbi:LapA family protein [Aliiglaciecola lipolytica]|uniref:Lipopolysaccharide assembly protein A domain-containing protein n=1 Tax=Aliiglaciecola lipolytica E3 TaxID=1127673 RepID=K6Y8Z5_9ALTE|nr:LapA family protein [Aliiglaciecola lipolytica]GAC14677.1 hypothetical protein GLIP_2049 [Aliiglaciecola lipolytica E3]
MHKIHHYLIITLLVLAVILILQNIQIMTVQVFFWQISMPRAVLIALMLLIGFIIGFLFKTNKKSALK